MINEILSERSDLFEPNVYIGFKLTISGKINSTQIAEAVYKAYQVNETTMSRVVITSDGKAYYDRMESTGCKVNVVEGDYLKVLAHNMKQCFDLKNGELIRTFIIPKNNSFDLLIMAHHLVGDGKAISQFAREVLEALNGEELEYRSANILTTKELNSAGALPSLLKYLIHVTNRKWEKTGRVFDWNDYVNIHTKYWSDHETEIHINSIEEDELMELKECASNCGVSLNSYLVAKLQKDCITRKIIGIPVSIRNNDKSMNNKTTGIRVKHTYNTHRSLEWNAIHIHKKIHHQLTNKILKLLALTYIAEVTGSMIDGVIMQTHDLYDHVLTRRKAKYIGYMGKYRTQLGVTNLGIIDISGVFTNFKVEDVLFIPPKVSYADIVIGVSTFNKKLSISTVEIKK